MFIQKGSLKDIGMPINKTKAFLNPLPLYFKGQPFFFSMLGRLRDPVQFLSNTNTSFNSSLGSSLAPSSKAFDITFTYTTFCFTQSLVVVMA